MYLSHVMGSKLAVAPLSVTVTGTTPVLLYVDNSSHPPQEILVHTPYEVLRTWYKSVVLLHRSVHADPPGPSSGLGPSYTRRLGLAGSGL